jgi:vitamin B12 transporter
MKTSKLVKGKRVLLGVLISSVLLVPVTGVGYAAEPSDYSFDQVVVTATKTPVKQFEANANISVITREQIEKSHYQDLTEALRTVPGVGINNYGAGVGTGYTNSLSINGSTNIVVLIDGVRANINGSGFPATLITSMDNIERIEVLKGAASTLYGSDAQGGVINIITRKAETNKTTLTMIGGSSDKENYTLSNQGMSGDYSWFITSQKDISGNYEDGHGNELPTHLNGISNTFKLTKKINDASDITMSYDEYQDNFLYSYYGPNTGSNHNYNWQINYKYAFSPDATNSLTFYTHRNKMDTYYDGGYPWLMDTKTKGVQDQFTQKIGTAHVLTTGFDIYQDDMVHYQSGVIDNSPVTGKTVTDRAVYVQDEWNLSDRWKLTSGLRDDNNSIYGTHATPSVNLGYKQDDKTNYYVAYKEFFISPNFYQLYDGLHGNQNLKAETGHTTEAGVNHKFNDSLTATTHIFETSSKNKFNVPSPYGTDLYENIDHDIIHGWDVQLNKQWSHSVNTFIGYTHLTESTVSQYASTPEGNWNVGMNYQQDKWDVAIQGNGYIGAPQYLPCSTYWVWNTAINYDVTKGTKVFFKVNNLFNKYYAEYTDGSGPYGGWDYYTSPGRNYQFGVQYQF